MIFGYDYTNHIMVNIYCLIDPRNDEMFYIGKARSPIRARLDNHISLARAGDEAPTMQRIREILAEGMRPKIERLVIVSLAHWKEAERAYIAGYRASGYKLTNSNRGGGGG